MYEQPSAGRRIGPALIAVLVVLAAVAGTGAYLVARRVIANQAASTGNDPATGATGTPTPAPTPTIPQGPQTTPRATENPKDPATFCPAITEKAVTDAGLPGDLELLRYVDGTKQNAAAAEAWICKNSEGVLFYQGHRKSGEFLAATSDHTILIGLGILGKVITDGDDAFVAYNPKDPTDPDDPEHTAYHVSPKTFFFIEKPKEVRTEYTLVRTVPAP